MVDGRFARKGTDVFLNRHARPAVIRPTSAGVLPVSLMLTGLAAALCASASTAIAEPRHAIAMHGQPLYPRDFKAFAYIDPSAPKSGRITYGVQGSFDSLNPFIPKGDASRGLRDGGHENYVFEGMMVRGQDEAFTLYCLICATVEVPPDRSWVEFKIRPEAAFSDGTPLTSADVAHSFQLLRENGRPNVTIPYKKVDRVETPDSATVRFVFKDGGDRELALIMGSMPILPKHKVSAEDFPKTTLVAPTGSGPYVVATVDPGARLVLKRNPNYWGRDLSVNRGLNNYDEIRFEYYRSENALFEAFKAGLVDVLPEADPSRWSTRYDFPAVADGRVVKDIIPTALPKGMYGFVFNTRRPVFSDIRVREALASLFDFEWVNKNLYFGLYRRSGSYFEGSELSSLGRPADATERGLLAAYPDAVRTDVMDGRWKPTGTDGSGRDRAVLKAAIDLLATAGWKLDNGAMRNAAGEAMQFELIIQSPDQERVALAYQRTLKQIGVEASVRALDSSQYQRRWSTFDFDMLPWSYGASLSPGNEQLQRWSAVAAEKQGSFNFAGAREPAIDAMIGAMLEATSREAFVSATRAFDRVLISGFYVVPLFHKSDQWIARWGRIARPETSSVWGAVLGAWYVKSSAP
jgi:peptide/nickel transport system substrate-binding protein